MGTDQAVHRSVGFLQQLSQQMAAEKTGRAGQQHCIATCLGRSAPGRADAGVKHRVGLCFRALVSVIGSAAVLVNGPGQTLNGRVFQEGVERERRRYLVTDPGIDGRQQDRRATHVEKVVGHAKGLAAQAVGPDVIDDLLGLSARRDDVVACLFVDHRVRQLLAVDLATLRNR